MPLFEPVHGAAPTIAGEGTANPTGALLSMAMLLEHGLKRPELGRAVEASVEAALKTTRTPDIGGNATTGEFTTAVLEHLAWARWAHEEQQDDRATAWAV